MPNQDPRNPFPAWRLPNGIINANESELERSIESCELWEWFGGGLVVFGVAATVVIAATHPPYDSFWERWGSAIADGFVAIGVALEIKFGQMAGLRQHELKRRSDEQIAEANKIAAHAVKDAADARERTAEVERLTAWRRIDPATRSKILTAFDGKAPILKLRIEHEMGDPEAFAFAQVVRLFKELGVAEISFNSNAHLGMTVFGVIVRVGDSENKDEICEACLKAFAITVKLESLKGVYGSADIIPNLYLFVGPKIPEMSEASERSARESST